MDGIWQNIAKVFKKTSNIPEVNNDTERNIESDAGSIYNVANNNEQNTNNAGFLNNLINPLEDKEFHEFINLFCAIAQNSYDDNSKYKTELPEAGFDKITVNNIKNEFAFKIDEIVEKYLNKDNPTDAEIEKALFLYTIVSDFDSMETTMQKYFDTEGVVDNAYNYMKDITGLGFSRNELNEYIENERYKTQVLTAALKHGKISVVETNETISQEKMLEEGAISSSLINTIVVNKLENCETYEEMMDYATSYLGMSEDEVFSLIQEKYDKNPQYYETSCIQKNENGEYYFANDGILENYTLNEYFKDYDLDYIKNISQVIVQEYAKKDEYTFDEMYSFFTGVDYSIEAVNILAQKKPIYEEAVNLYSMTTLQEELFTTTASPLDVVKYFEKMYDCTKEESIEMFNRYYESMLSELKKDGFARVNEQMGMELTGMFLSEDGKTMSIQYSPLENFDEAFLECQGYIYDKENNLIIKEQELYYKNPNTYEENELLDIQGEVYDVFNSINVAIDDNDVFWNLNKKEFEEKNQEQYGTFETIVQEYNEAHYNAYGRNILNEKFEIYQKSMDSYSATISSIFSVAGIATGFSNPALGLCFSLLGTFGDNGIDLVNLLTNDADNTKEVDKWLQDTTKDAVYMAIGMGLGKTSASCGNLIADIMLDKGDDVAKALFAGKTTEAITGLFSGLSFDFSSTMLEQYIANGGNLSSEEIKNIFTSNLFNNLLSSGLDITNGVVLYRSIKAQQAKIALNDIIVLNNKNKGNSEIYSTAKQSYEQKNFDEAVQQQVKTKNETEVKNEDSQQAKPENKLRLDADIQQAEKFENQPKLTQKQQEALTKLQQRVKEKPHLTELLNEMTQVNPEALEVAQLLIDSSVFPEEAIRNASSLTVDKINEAKRVYFGAINQLFPQGYGNAKQRELNCYAARILKTYLLTGDVQYCRKMGSKETYGEMALECFQEKASKIDGTILQQPIEDLMKQLEIPKNTTPIAERNMGSYAEFLSTKKIEFEDGTQMVFSLVEDALMEAKIDFGNGIPLEYPRRQFIEDLNAILDSDACSALHKREILDKLQIEISSVEGRYSYDGILNYSQLDLNNPIEKEVYDIAHRFISGNRATTDDEELNKALNYLIEAFPEFVNTVGKKQHSGQSYTLDVHILKALQETISHPDYASLSDYDKNCLKTAVILHDISKLEARMDSEHAKSSAHWAQDILGAMKLPEGMKDRIVELVLNHHWLQELNTGGAKIPNIALAQRRRNDTLVSKIFTTADIKANKYNNHGYEVEPKAAEITKVVDQNHQKGQMLFTSRRTDVTEAFKRGILEKYDIDIDEILAQKGIQINQTFECKDGTMLDLTVLDFTKVDEDTDMSIFGFAPGTKPSDLRFLVHMSNDEGFEKIVTTLSQPTKNAPQSTAYISLSQNPSYYQMSIGIGVEAEMDNIAIAYKENFGSGKKKEFNEIPLLNAKNARIRSYLPDEISKSLGITSAQYANLYEQVSRCENIQQIKDDQFFYVNGMEISGENLKKAIASANDKLLSYTGNNEAVVIAPKANSLIAKVDKIEDIPESSLLFAYENNLPIYILGK